MIARARAQRKFVVRPYVHAGINFRSMTRTGMLRGHCLEYIAACVRVPPPGEELVVGDGRFAAPELFDGEHPTLASDVFAAAAVYCARNATDKPKCFPRDRIGSCCLLPPERVRTLRPHKEAHATGLLLSLLDDDPDVRESALEEIAKEGQPVAAPAFPAPTPGPNIHGQPWKPPRTNRAVPPTLPGDTPIENLVSE